MRAFFLDKSEEEISINEKITEFVQDRAKRDTILSYGDMYLGMFPDNFKKSRYARYRSIDEKDTIIDNNMNAYEVSVYAHCYTDSLSEIELFNPSFSDAELFNAIRDMYISKYGPFSLYHTCPNKVDYNFYTINQTYFYTDLLSQGNEDIKDFVSFHRPLIVDYIWCWANCYIRLYQNKDGISIVYRLHSKDSKGKISSFYLDYILPQEPDTISNADKKRLKESQSI